MKKTSFVLGLISAVFACNLLFTSCSEPMEVEKFTMLEKRVLTGEDSMIDGYERTKVTDAHSGTFISRTDSLHPYGIGTVFTLNDTNLNKDLRININLWARTNLIEPGYNFAVSVQDGDKVIVWQEMDVKKHLKTSNTWTNVTDSITVSGGQLNKPGLILKTFIFNPNNLSKTIILDSDDLEISLKTVEKVMAE